MENKLLQGILKQFIGFFVVFLVMVTVVTSVTSLEAKKTKEQASVKVEESPKKPKKKEKIDARINTASTSKEIKKKLGDTYILIRKHQKEVLPVNLQDLYKSRQVKLTIYHLRQEIFQPTDVTWVIAGKEITGKKLKKLQTGVALSYQEEEGHYLQAELVLGVDSIYGYQIFEDEAYIYIDCRQPKEVYKKILVLDAGHGGKDTGTYARSGSWSEKDFNLDFVGRMEEYWDSDEIKLYVTRDIDRSLTLQERVGLANDLQADWFISIHCNSTDDATGSGLEALYKSNSYKKESKAMAKLCLEKLSKATELENRGMLNGQSIFIIRKAKMPMVLLEMGFLTDKRDLAYMKKEKNRDKMAKTVCKAIMEGMEIIQ